MTLFSILVLLHLMFLVHKELPLSTALEIFIGEQNFPIKIHRSNLSKQSKMINDLFPDSKSPHDLQDYHRVRRMLQQLKFNKGKIRIIEKAFFYAFKKCHLSDVTDLVPLEEEVRNEQKKCVVEKLEDLENFSGEYTQYLRNDTDINESEVVLERLNMEKENSLNIKNNDNLSNLNNPVKESEINVKTPYSSNASNVLKTSFKKIKNAHSVKYIDEKTTKHNKPEVGNTDIKQITDLPNFPSITLGGDGSDTQRGLILYMNFTVNPEDQFSIVDSPDQLSQVLKSIPQTLNYVIGHINRRKGNANVAQR